MKPEELGAHVQENLVRHGRFAVPKLGVFSILGIGASREPMVLFRADTYLHELLRKDNKPGPEEVPSASSTLEETGTYIAHQVADGKYVSWPNFGDLYASSGPGAPASPAKPGATVSVTLADGTTTTHPKRWLAIFSAAGESSMYAPHAKPR